MKNIAIGSSFAAGLFLIASSLKKKVNSDDSMEKVQPELVFNSLEEAEQKKKEFTDGFYSYFPLVVDTLLEDFHTKANQSQQEREEDDFFFKIVDPQDRDFSPVFFQHLKNMLEYNCKGGKCLRGLAVQETLLHICQGMISKEQLHIARVVGWAIEIVEGFFLLADDIMDKAETRRGKTCWYLLEEYETTAVNDAFFLESSIFRLFKKMVFPSIQKIILANCPNSSTPIIFGSAIGNNDEKERIDDESQKVLSEFHDLFHQVIYQTEIGQFLDTKTSSMAAKQQQKLYPSESSNEMPLEHEFSLEMFHKIAKYKTSFYTFFLPMASGYLVSLIGTRMRTRPGITPKQCKNQDLKNLQSLCVKMGVYFQAQDDVLDCFADPKILGKIGTDIEDCKCTWLFGKALEILKKEDSESHKEMLKTLLSSYGKTENEEVEKVKKIYKDLELDKIWSKIEDEMYLEIQQETKKYPIFGKAAEVYLNKLQKRIK